MNQRQQAETVRQVQERRRSGAAGKHADRRTRRLRTRSASRRRAITRRTDPMLTESQRAVLATLRRTTDREGPLTTTDLTPYLPSLDRPKVAAAIKSLAAAGLIRRAGVGDRNAPTFAVTDQGRAALTQEG